MTEPSASPARPPAHLLRLARLPEGAGRQRTHSHALRAEGYELSRSHAGADAVIVNTCGFLDSAKKESLEAIGAAMAENGRVIVTGCMGAEPEQIRDAFPNVSRDHRPAGLRERDGGGARGRARAA